MRAKVLSHLVDRFTNKNAGNHCTSQSSNLIENLANQNATYASKPPFSFNELPNRIPSSTNQSIDEPDDRNSLIPGDDRHSALSVHIPKIVDRQKTNSPVFDQNNNVQPIQIDSQLNNLGKTNVQTGPTRGNLADNVRLVDSAGLVKIASPNATTITPSPVQFIASGTVPLQSNSIQLASTQVQYEGSAILQPNTMTPLNILQSREVRLPSSPVQLTGPTHVSDKVWTSQDTPTTTAQNLVQYLNYSATPFANPVDGQLTILVPANVIHLPTLSPSGSAVFLACDGSNSASPVSSIQSSLHRLTDTANEKVALNDVNKFGNVNNVHVQNSVSREMNRTAESVKFDALPETVDSTFINTNNSIVKDKIIRPAPTDNKNRCRPYDTTAFRQTKNSHEKFVTFTETPNTMNEYRSNNCDAIQTFGKGVNTNYNSQYQKNVSPPIIEFQTDRISSLNGLTNRQNTEIDMRSCFSKEHQTSYSANVWRPWNM